MAQKETASQERVEGTVFFLFTTKMDSKAFENFSQRQMEKQMNKKDNALKVLYSKVNEKTKHHQGVGMGYKASKTFVRKYGFDFKKRWQK